ncbi:succinoglycan biosynthesis protein ExoL [Devosia sp. UYZn731]|uniref:glycosyl transferase family 1 n=1 Tax=Devosia sp. UYZn731 TaxID=3156345 RepID=UPI003395ED89
MLKILYLVPNLADPAVARRVDMLRLGGAQIHVAGFRRAGTAVPTLDVATYLELDQTFDARFAQRLLATAKAMSGARQWASRLPRPDLIIARNLEMLGLANRLRAFWPEQPPIVYECLDIHRLMLREDAIGRAMRGAERHWSKQAALLLTSSPAFSRNYFDLHGSLPTEVVENKVIWDGGERGSNPALTAKTTGPLRIGWFGALRCARSLEALGSLADAMDGDVEMVLRGRPALTEFNDFNAIVAGQEHLRFAGPYRNPDDLAAIYSDVHLAWAIDFFEEGQNSKWLLPNRLYEGCLHGAVPVALAGTETAAFLERRGIGIVLPDIAPQTLRTMLGGLTRERLVQLAGAVAAQDTARFAVNTTDCVALVNKLAGLLAAPTRLTEAA